MYNFRKTKKRIGKNVKKKEAKTFGFKINQEKTKYMIMENMQQYK